MAGLIAWEIIISNRRYVSIIFIQIILLGISIAWSQLLIFPSLVGVDPWYHSVFTNSIIDEGYIPWGSYSKLPLFHLIIASTSLLVDLPYKFATMLSVSIGQIICNAMFIFLIANYLIKNHRIGLLASLLAIIANHHIFMSYWSIPNGFGVIFIPMILYLLLSRMRTNHQGNEAVFRTIITLLLMAVIVLTHTVAAMSMAIILFIAWIAMKCHGGLWTRAGNNVALSIPLGFTVAMFAWWTYASGHVQDLGNLVEWGFSADYFGSSPAEAVSYSLSVPLSEQLFNNLGMFLFFALSFIGIFYMISRRGDSMTFTMSWVMITPLVIGFFSLITGHSVLEHRWWYLAQILLSAPLSIAICLAGTWKSKRSVFAPALISGFVILLSFLLIVSPPANGDNATFSSETTRSALTASELQAQTILSYHDGIIISDKYYATRLSFFDHDTDTFCEEILNKNLLSLEGDLILIRGAVIDGPFSLYMTSYKLDYDLLGSLNNSTFSRIYDNGSVYAYL